MPSTEGPELEPLLQRIIRLRAVVLALGESAEPPWWRTTFLTETGLRFLERLYPKSAFPAALHAAGKAASEIHDQAIGRRGVYHLFRLPEELEARISTLARESLTTTANPLRQELANMDLMIARLSEAAPGTPAESAGPVRIGSAVDIGRETSWQLVASIYRAAFHRKVRAFPYFEADGAGVL